jgi:hypothetical protein
MLKYIVHTKSIPGVKSPSAPTIVQVECEVVTVLEDPSVISMPLGELKYRILKPAFLLEPQEVKLPDGTKKKVMAPPVYYSHSVYPTDGLAILIATQMIRAEFEFEVRKGRSEGYSQEELLAKVSQIQTLLLP